VSHKSQKKLHGEPANMCTELTSVCVVAEQITGFRGTARQGPNTSLCHTLMKMLRFSGSCCEETVILPFRKEDAIIVEVTQIA
jgi:hypothetical protein